MIREGIAHKVVAPPFIGKRGGIPIIVTYFFSNFEAMEV